MKFVRGSFVIALFALSLFAQGVWTPETQVKMKAIGAVCVSPDNKRVVYTVREAVMTPDRSEFVTQVWVADINGSNHRQLTSGEKPSTNPQWSPDGGSIAFTSTQNGNRNNLYLLRVEGGEPEALTDLRGSVANYKWSPDGKMIAFTMLDPKSETDEQNEKGRNDFRWMHENPKLLRLYVVPVEKDATGKREIRLLTTDSYKLLFNFDWSPDSKTIAFARVPSDSWRPLNDGADIALVDVATAKVTLLANTPALEIWPYYSPDGKSVAAFVSENPPTWAGNGQINIFPAAGGKPKILSPILDGESVDMIGWSTDGKRIFFTEPKGTVTRIYAVDVATNTVSELNSGTEFLQEVSLNESGAYFGFVRQTNETPPEAFVSPVDKFAPVQISRANADTAGKPIGKTEVIRWKSKDGQEVEGLLTYPVGYQPGTRVPLILFIHGGPVGAYQQNYIGVPSAGTYPIASLAERGYAILRPNPRGSSGYGNEFRRALINNWSIVDYQDVMSGVDRVVEMGVADEERLGVMGSSYGGYLSAWIVTQTKRFKAASIRAPMTNPMTSPAMSDITGFLRDHFGGEFWDVPENYIKRSPIFHVKNVSTPTLIQHGEADPRVPIGQSYEFYYALKARGVPTRFMILPRQPHSPVEPKMQIAVMQANLDWFEKYLGAGTAGKR